MAVQAILAAGSVLTGVFGGGGPDPKKVAERTAQVGALKSLAAQGNVNAWQALGAVGRVHPTPAGGLTIPGVETYGANWTSVKWGDDYNPIIRSAAAAYNAYAPQFALSGVAATAAQGAGIVPNKGAPPVATEATGGINSQVGPSTMVNSLTAWIAAVPTLVWVVVLLLLLFLLRR